MLGKDGLQRTQPAGGLHIAHYPNQHQWGCLDDGHGLHNLMLVALWKTVIGDKVTSFIVSRVVLEQLDQTYIYLNSGCLGLVGQILLCDWWVRFYIFAINLI